MKDKAYSDAKKFTRVFVLVEHVAQITLTQVGRIPQNLKAYLYAN